MTRVVTISSGGPAPCNLTLRMSAARAASRSPAPSPGARQATRGTDDGHVVAGAHWSCASRETGVYLPYGRSEIVVTRSRVEEVPYVYDALSLSLQAR